MSAYVRDQDIDLILIAGEHLTIVLSLIVILMAIRIFYCLSADEH